MARGRWRYLPGVLLALVVVLGLAAAARDGVDRWVARTELPALVSETSVEMRDRHGDLLRAYTVADGRWRLRLGGGITGEGPSARAGGQNGAPNANGGQANAPAAAHADGRVDPRYIAMLLAYEDKRFYRHHGVDPWAALRAGWQALRHGGVVSGGSTITMQVARLLEESGTGRWHGKLRQLRVALALERRLDKPAILDLYLTHAPFGGNLEGIRAATLAWFGKEPARLTPAEAAMLIALPQSPEARRPDVAPGAARAARDRVLARMVVAGVLDAATADAARGDPVPVRRRGFAALAPHLSDRARDEVPERQRHDLTLDGGLQRSLETLAGDTLRGTQPGLSVAILVADHQNGEVLASVGSAGLNAAPGRQGFVDMTRALRSPGSTLKPLVYAMAFDAGLAHPETLIDDRPVRFGPYAPQNFDGRFRGEVRVADALRLSLNLPVVMLADALGPENVLAAMRRAGMRPVLPGGRAGLALTLGGVGVTLEDMVTLYAGLASGGVARPLRHRMDGAVPGGARVVSRAAAWQVGHILSGLAPPPGAPLNRLAYKTGTSYGHRDAWAIGFDGRHVVGVWIGRPDGTPVPGAFGADMAAPLLFEVFQRVKPTLDPLPAPPPETLMVGAALLPEPLRRFRARGAVFAPEPDAPVLAFPPEGAVVAAQAGGVVVKVDAGRGPFTFLANGRVVALAARRREVMLEGLGAGFADIAVIDALGRSARVRIRIE